MSTVFTPIDEHVRHEIRTALDETLMVEAGAGTGKTTVLVGRIVELLRRGPYGVDDVAVMTFTEAAAAELGARVREGLEDALRGSTNAADTLRLKAALAGLHRARVETIHAFASNLLRERPVEASLDPQFEVLDGLGARLAFDRCYEAWIAGLFTQERAEITTALHRGMETKHLRAIAEALHAHRYALPLAPIRTSQRTAVPELTAWLRREASTIDALTNRCANEENKACLNGRAILGFGVLLSAVEGDALQFERALLFRAPHANKTAGNSKDWTDKQDTKDLKLLIGEFLVLRDDAQRELRAEAIAGVMPLVETFVTDFETQRRQAGTADFDDLLIWSRDLVCDDPLVRDYFHRRFPRILVDEFQDTDPIKPSSSCASPQTRTPRTGALCGPHPDTCSSSATPNSRSTASAAPTSLSTTSCAAAASPPAFATSPRTSAPSQACSTGPTAYLTGSSSKRPASSPPTSPSPPSRPLLPEQRPGVVAVHGSGGGSLSAAEIRAAEGLLLARTIDRAVNHEHWPVRDCRTGHQRACEYRDVAILIPSRTDIEAYTEPLDALDIPYRMEGGTRLYDRQEVRDLVATLHAIDDPNDRISLVAALRSPGFGCSDADLFTWVADGGRLDARQRLNGETGPVADGLRVLAGLRRERRGLSLSELVGRVLAQTRLVEIALAQPGGEQAAANLLKLVDEARAFAGAGGGGLRPFAGWLAERRDGIGDEEEAGLHEETDDIVRILTIHGAKGLEFPVVALAKPNTKRHNDNAPVADTQTHRLDIKVGPFETAGWETALADEAQAGEAERRRLLYVACTRARDHLIIPIVPAAGKRTGMLQLLEPQLPEWAPETAGDDVDGCLLYDRGLLAQYDVAPSSHPDSSLNGRPADQQAPIDEVDGARLDRTEWRDARADLLSDAGRELAMITASSVERLWQRPLTIELNEADGTIIATGNGPPLPLGDAFHRVMEVVDLGDPGSLAAIVAAVCSESGLADREAEVGVQPR